MTGQAEAQSVGELMEAGWGVVTCNGTAFIEPRTRVSFPLEDALEIYKRHQESEGGTKVIAVRIGSEVHGAAYTQFGKPHARTDETVKKWGGGTEFIQISIWYVPRKEGEQFMSKAGHENKKRGAATT